MSSSNSLVNRCQGWTNPSTSFYGPVILSLSSYYSPAGLTNLVTISGENFYSYSTVLFATYSPSVYFINSNTLQFYVPSSLYPGSYPVQVYNGSTGSNIVTYTLDNSSGYWILNPNNSITNTNVGGLELAGPIQFSDGTTQNTAYNPLIGEIKMFGGIGPSPPINYLWCDGQSYNVSNYPALVSVIGNTYGGDGINTFNVPNLLQKFPIGSKDNTNMSIIYNDGNVIVNALTGGNQAMNVNQLGTHSHTFSGNTTINSGSYIENLDANNATNTTVTTAPTGQRVVNVNKSVANFNTLSLTTTGTISDNIRTTTGQEDLLPPFSVVNYIICYQ